MISPIAAGQMNSLKFSNTNRISPAINGDVWTFGKRVGHCRAVALAARRIGRCLMAMVRRGSRKSLQPIQIDSPETTPGNRFKEVCRHSFRFRSEKCIHVYNRCQVSVFFKPDMGPVRTFTLRRSQKVFLSASFRKNNLVENDYI